MIEDAAAPERTIARAYRAVSARERTEAELRALLLRAGEAEAVVEAALDELRRGGYLDDGAYARRFAEDRRRLDGWGAERIARDLIRRGVDRALIDDALAGDPAGELELARELLARRFPVPPADDRERARAWRFLAARGHPSEVAYAAVRAHERGGDAAA